MVMGEGCGIFVLEMADYVLTGSRSKLWAVVTLSEGLRKGERVRGRERDVVLLLIDDDCDWQGGGGGKGHGQLSVNLGLFMEMRLSVSVAFRL